MTTADAIREGSYAFTHLSHSKTKRVYTLSELEGMTKSTLILLLGQIHPGTGENGRVGAGVYRGLLQCDKRSIIAAIVGLRLLPQLSPDQPIQISGTRIKSVEPVQETSRFLDL